MRTRTDRSKRFCNSTGLIDRTVGVSLSHCVVKRRVRSRLIRSRATGALGSVVIDIRRHRKGECLAVRSMTPGACRRTISIGSGTHIRAIVVVIIDRASTFGACVVTCAIIGVDFIRAECPSGLYFCCQNTERCDEGKGVKNARPDATICKRLFHNGCVLLLVFGLISYFRSLEPKRTGEGNRSIACDFVSRRP